MQCTKWVQLYSYFFLSGWWNRANFLSFSLTSISRTCILYIFPFKPCDILVRIWIRILWSAPLTNGSWSGAGSCSFPLWYSRRQQKTILRLIPFLKSENSRNQGFSSFFCLLMEGSGFRTNKLRLLIRIQKAEKNIRYGAGYGSGTQPEPVPARIYWT